MRKKYNVMKVVDTRLHCQGIYIINNETKQKTFYFADKESIKNAKKFYNVIKTQNGTKKYTIINA